MNPNAAKIRANDGRQPTGVLSLRAFSFPSAHFTAGDAWESRSKTLGLRKTGGLTSAVRLSVCNYGVKADEGMQRFNVQRVFRATLALLTGRMTKGTDPARISRHPDATVRTLLLPNSRPVHDGPLAAMRSTAQSEPRAKQPLRVFVKDLLLLGVRQFCLVNADSLHRGQVQGRIRAKQDPVGTDFTDRPFNEPGSDRPVLEVSVKTLPWRLRCIPRTWWV